MCRTSHTPCKLPGFSEIERLLCKQEVAGSIPAGSISKVLEIEHFLGFRRRGDRSVVSSIYDFGSLNVREIRCHDRYPAASSPAALADDTLVVDVKIRGELRCLARGPPPSGARRASGTCLRTDCCRRRDCARTGPRSSPGTQLGSATDAGIRSLTVREAATEYVESLGRYENPRTLDAYRSPVVKHLLPFLAYVDDARTEDRALVDVDEALMLRFVAAKQAERAVLQDVAETLAELDRATRADLDLLSREFDEDEWRLLRRYGQRGGRHKILDPSATGVVSLSSRGLNNNEINRCLARMRDVVRMANRRYKLGVDDPTQGCSLPREDPSREWLHPVQMQALIDAAEALDANPAQDAYAQHGRYSAILALGLLGPRVSEFCAARWRDLSSGGALHTGGEDERRPPAPRAADDRPRRLGTAPGRARPPPQRLDLGVGRRHQARPQQRAQPATGAGARARRRSARGTGPTPLRARVDADGNPTGIRVTPHMFRRTAMTYWAWADRNQRWAMGQAGHESAKMTLEAYQQTFPRDHDARALVAAWLGGAGAGTA